MIAQAGWTNEPAREALTLSYAASKWQDHYEQDNVSRPGDNRIGLFGLNPVTVASDFPRELLDPRTNARAAFRLWVNNGRSFDWHPLYDDPDKVQLRRAFSEIQAGRLDTLTAAQMPASPIIRPMWYPHRDLSTIRYEAPVAGDIHGLET